MTKRLVLVLAIVFSFLAAVSSYAPVAAKDSWTSVRSKNFLLIGNASEKDIQKVALRLEQFREVFSRLLTTLKVNSVVPTTVMVFKNEESYRPFKPNKNTAGYFQPGPDVNYITLEISTDPNSDQDPFHIIFHEYTHLLVKNTSGNVPAWFNEGLAEYYSTFSIVDQKVLLGKLIVSHVLRLRQSKMLPLRTLFQIDHQSPYYNERDKQSIFYAESWALVHYLILGKEGKRRNQLSKFVDLVSAGTPAEQAFQDAFAMTIESMEKELYSYIQRNSYPIQISSFRDKVDYDGTMKSAPISEAETQAYLGDLLLKSNRTIDCEVYLQKALALDPDLPMANASLGLLRMRQDRHAEARKSLERALAGSTQNYLIHYYYAYALSQVGLHDMHEVMGMAPETAAIIRRELKRAIELRPDFLESYSLLAFVNLATGTDLDQTLEMLKQALAGAPHRNDLRFMLAQVYLRRNDFKPARELTDKLIAEGDAEMRESGKRLLAQLVSIEELTRRNQDDKALAPGLRNTVRDESGAATETIVMPFDPAAALRDSLRKPLAGETQTQGALTRIDCDARTITFVVKAGDRLLKLNIDTFQHAHIVSFSDDAGRQITCGSRKPPTNVVVAYLAASDARSKIDGVLKSVEFVPPDFKLKP